MSEAWLRSSFLIHMPYRTRHDLPLKLQEILPEHAQDIFVKSFNSAWEEHLKNANHPDASQEEVAFRIAWSAVKRKYSKDKRTGKWIEKS